ncbi:MAG TPA: sulfatase-like hydrolase/transferase [Thermoanaerobaculia bacterium]|nr:sulfatase-like hydrolase/transferase [Thermoanaerobaculia bacterium]
MKRPLTFALLLALACSKPETPATPAAASAPRPSILLVTLDTTRADAIGEATPSFNALAARGRSFTSAYATVPQTLPSHSSMMTGLYPAGHGVRENARFLTTNQPVLAEKLKGAGYRTAAFVSAFAVAKRFGIGRGFDVYDEAFGKDRAERTARETTERALAYLQSPSDAPLFLWVHYYDPHYPYTPPEPYRTRFAQQSYLGEVAAMDEQLGRLVRAFEQRASGAKAIVVVADHGEGLGEHGEQQHGNLLYQTTMHVPFVIVGPGFDRSTSRTPVSTRRIFHTVLDWAGLDSTNSLRGDEREDAIAGEAMKPFLDYGWQPQVMAVEGNIKAIMAGRLEVYDVAADPHETKNLAATASLARPIRATLRDYPLPSGKGAEPPANLDDEAQKKLASLGYVSSSAKPVIRKDAPVPADMAPLFPILDKASGLFVRQQYAQAIPLLEQIAAKDPYNLDAALRLASAHSALNRDAEALAAFRRAEAIAPDSPDVRTYLALHYAKGSEWPRAVPMLERIVREEPDRLPPLEALAVIRERQNRIDEAVALRRKIYSLRAATPAELLRLAQMQMALGQTENAIASFEQARAQQSDAFRNHLELGVLYLAAGRYDDARTALDRIPPSHPDYAMALFKRAQVSVLLREPDAAARIAQAKQHADATTRVLIERERLFR